MAWRIKIRYSNTTDFNLLVHSDSACLQIGLRTMAAVIALAASAGRCNRVDKPPTHQETTAMLIALTESELLFTVIGVYLTLAGLWFVYWLFERMTSSSANSRSVNRVAVQKRRDLGLAETRALAKAQAAASESQHHAAPAEAALRRDEIQKLRSELQTVASQSSANESRLKTLQVEVEALQLSLADKLAKLESPSTAEEVSETDPPILSIFDPKLQSYDPDWTVIDPDLGIVIAKRPNDADDLTRVWGIGEVYQTQLNEHGVYYFRQIADWSDHNVERFNVLLSFKGRIEREDWVGQAKQLAGQQVQRQAA